MASFLSHGTPHVGPGGSPALFWEGLGVLLFLKKVARILN